MPGFVNKDIARQIEDEMLKLEEQIDRAMQKINSLIEIGGGSNAVFAAKRRGPFTALWTKLNTMRADMNDSASARPAPPTDPPTPPEV